MLMLASAVLHARRQRAAARATQFRKVLMDASRDILASITPPIYDYDELYFDARAAAPPSAARPAQIRSLLD